MELHANDSNAKRHLKLQTQAKFSQERKRCLVQIEVAQQTIY